MKCFEYFDCKKKECPIFKGSEKACWELEGTLCNHPAKNIVKSGKVLKENICHSCLYYAQQKDK